MLIELLMIKYKQKEHNISIDIIISQEEAEKRCYAGSQNASENRDYSYCYQDLMMNTTYGLGEVACKHTLLTKSMQRCSTAIDS